MFAPQSEHVRLASELSALIRSPTAHVACAVHDVSRWDFESWYVSDGHALHDRSDSSVSALARSDNPQVG